MTENATTGMRSSSGRKAKLNRSPEWDISARKLAELYLSQGGCCAMTGKPLDLEDAQPDHIRPRGGGHGGKDEMANLQIIHKRINRAKNTMACEDFIQMCRDVVSWADRESNGEGSQ